MNLKNKLATLTQAFTSLKEKILAKLTEKNDLIQVEKDSKQETIRQLETALRENSENEKAITQLLTDFQELIQQLEADA